MYTFLNAKIMTYQINQNYSNAFQDWAWLSTSNLLYTMKLFSYIKTM